MRFSGQSCAIHRPAIAPAIREVEALGFIWVTHASVRIEPQRLFCRVSNCGSIPSPSRNPAALPLRAFFCRSVVLGLRLPAS